MRNFFALLGLLLCFTCLVLHEVNIMPYENAVLNMIYFVAFIAYIKE